MENGIVGKGSKMTTIQINDMNGAADVSAKAPGPASPAALEGVVEGVDAGRVSQLLAARLLASMPIVVRDDAIARPESMTNAREAVMALRDLLNKYVVADQPSQLLVGVQVIGEILEGWTPDHERLTPRKPIEDFVRDATAMVVSLLDLSTVRAEDTPAEIKAVETQPHCGFTRATVDTLGDRVRMTDKDGSLEMFCYDDCTAEDSDLLQQCRGVVFDGEKIVLKAFPFTKEYGHSQVEEVTAALADFDSYRFYDAYEGALIRVFYVSDEKEEGRWYLSTHRKLDAFKSKWASRESFGDRFVQALGVTAGKSPEFTAALDAVDVPDDVGVLPRFLATLDKDQQYMFLVIHDEGNRIVCLAPEDPTVYHVGTFVDGKLDMDATTLLPRPTRHEFADAAELCAFVGNTNPMHLQGLICFGPHNTQIKVCHDEYLRLFSVRDNTPSIKFRYLQVRMDEQMYKDMATLYPESVSQFEDYENRLYMISGEIYQAYIDRFVRRQHVTLPQEEWRVAKACHKWYCDQRKAQRAKEATSTRGKRRNAVRVTRNLVIDQMNRLPPTALNRMIRRTIDAERAAEREEAGTDAGAAPTTELPVTEVDAAPEIPETDTEHDSAQDEAATAAVVAALDAETSREEESGSDEEESEEESEEEMSD